MKKVLSVLLALVFCFASLGAMAAEDNLFPRYDETVVMNVGQWISDEKNFPEGMSPENNAVYDLILEFCNIKLVPAFTTPKTDAYYEQGARLQMADRLPDMTGLNISTLYDAIRAEQLADLTEYYEQYATPTLKRMLEVNDSAFLDACTVDGKLYAIPSITDQFNQVPLMWIRTDWLEIVGWENAAGGAYPETYDDFEDMIYTFRDNYDKISEETGVEDVYAFAMYKDLGNPFNGIMAAHNAYPGIYLKDEQGSYYNAALTEEVKAGLATLRQYQDDGILRFDWATQPTEQIVADSAAGKVGVFFDEFWAPLAGQVGGLMWIALTQKEDNPGLSNADWVCVPIPSKDGDLIKPQVTRQAADYFVVSKNYDHPEALFFMLNLMAEGNNAEGTLKGPEAKEGFYSPFSTKYRELDDQYSGRMIYSWLPFFLDNPIKNADLSVKFVDVANGKLTVEDLLPSEKQVYDQVYSKDPFVSWQFYNIYIENGVPAAMKYPQYTNNAYVGAPTATQKSNGQTLLTTMNNAFINFISGTDSLDNFDAFVNEYNGLGGEAIIREITEISE